MITERKRKAFERRFQNLLKDPGRWQRHRLPMGRLVAAPM